MAKKPNYDFEKRKKELDRKAKRDEKIRNKRSESARLREESESLADALAARKSIERAKGLLMEKEAMSEQEAFARLRNASQKSGKPLKMIADAVNAVAFHAPRIADQETIIRYHRQRGEVAVRT